MQYKVRIQHDITASCSSYVYTIISEIKTIWNTTIEKENIPEALSAINSLVDDMEFVVNRKNKIKGYELKKEYSPNYDKLYVYNLSRTKVVLTISFELSLGKIFS